MKGLGGGRKLGPPELQVRGGVLPACENALKDESRHGRPKKLRVARARLLVTMPHSDPEDVAGWV
eukprot:7974262-Pyramimonas_sp.AAC.1